MKLKHQLSARKYQRIAQDPQAEIAVVHYRDSKDFYKIHEAKQAFLVGDKLYACVYTKNGKDVTHVRWDVSEGTPRKDSVTYHTLGLVNIF